MGFSKWCRAFKHGMGQITVEPIMFFFSFSHGLYMIAAQSLYISKVCAVNMNNTMDVCDNIYVHRDIQIEVQQYVSELQAYNGVLQALPAVIYALFAGPWSDTYGRRALIIWSCFGYVFNNGVFIINTIWFNELKAEYLLFECLQDFTGGSVTFFLGCYSYIADVSTKETRTKRLAFLDGLFPIGFFTGMSLSGIVKKKLGHIYNFGFGIGGALLAILYTAFFLKDSRKNRPPEVQEAFKIKEQMMADKPKKGKFQAMFDVENLKSAFRTTFKDRQYGMRKQMMLLGIIFLVEIFMIYGKGPTMFLFLRKELKMDEQKFGMYVAFFGFIGLFTQYCAVPFLTENLKWHDTTISFFGCVGSAIQQVIVAFAREDWMLYIAGCIAFLGPTITTSCRSLVTKLVGPFEVGTVFSILGAMQAMIPLLASPFYGFLYKSTIKTVPGMFLLVTACLYLFCAVMLMLVRFGLRKVEKRRLDAEKDAPEIKAVLVQNSIET